MEQQRNRPALPLLALLAIASALGVAVAVALAAVTMLLAAPAYAGEGSLFLERGAGLAPAERVFTEKESDLTGRVRVVEAYHNPFAEKLAGLYVYRLPPEAVLEHVSFWLRNGEARPALLTLRQGAALVERMLEIGPGETLRVQLEYRSRPARRVLAARCCSPS